MLSVQNTDISDFAVDMSSLPRISYINVNGCEKLRNINMNREHLQINNIVIIMPCSVNVTNLPSS